MKLHIAFDSQDMEQALQLAHQIAPAVDILEIGTPLLFAYGVSAISQFRTAFPSAILLADMKIVDRAKDTSTLGLRAGADWITVLAGTSKSVIHAATSTARDLGKRVMLDLIDASSPGQSALEAKSLGVDALLFHKPADDEESQLSFLERWEMVKGNTDLPIFISASITSEQATPALSLRPAGIVVSSTGLDLSNPLQDIARLRSHM